MDNIIEYHIYDLSKKDNNQENLNNLINSFLIQLERYTSGYIWQLEPIKFKIFNETSDEPIHIYGKVKFEDAIDDEWFIVFMLFELSKEYQDLLIKIIDNDGQFLLIECANELPNWINPENAENRVFVQNGKLNIIPLPQTPAELDVITDTISFETVKDVFLNHKEINTLASPEIQNTLIERISKIPQHLKNCYHTCRCYVPLPIAYILQKNQNLIAPAVSAFYTRDLIDMRYCSKMDTFFYNNNQEKERKKYPFVMTMVKFTKCLFAQLISQKFFPPKCFPTLPQNKSHPDFHAMEIGIKLTCGFEILYSRQNPPKNSNNKNNNNNFKLKKNKESKIIDNLLKENFNEAQFNNQKLHIDDSEDWLIVSPSEIDKMLSEKQKEYENYEKNQNEDTLPPNFNELTEKFKNFLSKVSDFEGIEDTDFEGIKDTDFEDIKNFDPEMLKIFEEMDLEVENNIENSFESFPTEEKEEKKQQKQNIKENQNQNQDNLKPLDLDFNLVKNLLQSYDSENGNSGPASLLLNQLSKPS